MVFVRKIVVSALLCAAFLSASATDYTFPTAGGDLASESAWGGTRPGASDKAIVDQDGTYTLSRDVSFGRFNVGAGACLFDFAGRKMTLATEARFVERKNDGRIVFNGGVLDFSSTANCYPLFVANDATTVFTNGCIVTNVANFYAMPYASRAKVEIAGAKVYATNLRVAHESGTDNTLEIYNGGQVYVSGLAYSEANGTVGAYGGHTLRVRGAGSLFKYTKSNGEFALGFQRNCNAIHVVDGGTIDFVGNGALLLGAWSNNHEAKTNNALVVERSATANIPKIRSNANRNRIFVGSGATLTTAKLQLNSSMNEVIISNATFTCTAPQDSTTASQEGFNLAVSATCTGNVFRIIGPSASISTLPWPSYWFNGSHHNVFSLEGGANWGADVHFDALFSKEQHCTFRVTGSGTVFGGAESPTSRFYLGNKNADVTATCASNVAEVCGGAAFNAASVWLSGTGNAFVVSNGTVDVKYLVAGFLYSASSIATNCMVRFCGTSPKVYVRGGSYCKIENNSILRFEIPKAGYADNHVPLELDCALTFDSTSRLEIDCEEFARDTYGTLTLIQSSSDISSAVRDRLLSNVSGLPPRSSLIVSGKTVKLRCPRVGSVIMVF